MATELGSKDRDAFKIGRPVDIASGQLQESGVKDTCLSLLSRSRCGFCGLLTPTQAVPMVPGHVVKGLGASPKRCQDLMNCQSTTPPTIHARPRSKDGRSTRA